MWLAIKSFRDRAQSLIRAKVPIAETNISSPVPLRVVAFPEEDLGRVIEVLGLSINLELTTETDHEGIWLLEVGEEKGDSSPPATVTVADWEGNNESGFVKTVEEILVPAVGDVVIHVPHGRTVAPASDGFHIFIWSALEGRKGDFKAPKKIWGIDVDCRDSGFKPSGQGVPIVDAETDWAVGELVGNNLYIHHDLCHHGTDQEIQIFRLLLEEVVAEMQLSPEKKAERQRKMQEEALARFRGIYVVECGRRLQKAFKETQRSLEESVRKQEEYSKLLTESIRAEANLRRKLEQLAEVQKNSVPQFGQEFDRLLMVPKIKTVRVQEGMLSVFTEYLYTNRLKKDGTVRELGEYRIDVPTAGGTPKIFNLTRTVGGHPHPHHAENNEPCLGNIKEGIAKLVGAYEYSVVAQILIQFLESINEEDSYGKRVYEWPVKPAGKEEKK